MGCDGGMKARWYFFGVFEALGPASSACWMGIGLPSCINDPSKELGRAGALLWKAPDWSVGNPPGSALRDLSRASSKLPRNWRKSWGALHPPNSPHHVDRAHLISSRARSLPSSRLETIEVDFTDHDGNDPILVFALFIHHVLLGIPFYPTGGSFMPMDFTVTVSSHCITMLRNDIQESHQQLNAFRCLLTPSLTDRPGLIDASFIPCTIMLSIRSNPIHKVFGSGHPV